LRDYFFSFCAYYAFIEIQVGYRLKLPGDLCRKSIATTNIDVNIASILVFGVTGVSVYYLRLFCGEFLEIAAGTMKG